MNAVPVVVKQASPRLSYVLDFLLCDLLGFNDYYFPEPGALLPEGIFYITYGVHQPGALSIPDMGLLWETGIRPRAITETHWQDLPVLFAAGEGYTLPFDILSAIFYLVSRYEEYLPYTPDDHGRYPATESILFQKDLLQRPIIDEWALQLRRLLRKDFGLDIQEPGFRYLPTYDIDIAWSYRHKGFWRSAGKLGRAFLSGHFAEARQQLAVQNGNIPDPYDAFDRIVQLHANRETKPLFFILAALRTTAYDKNIDPRHPAMQGLIRRLNTTGGIGLHPSYYAADPAVFAKEHRILESITGKKIELSRQHYIKLKLPDTYELLPGMDIYDDYSMGYGSHTGFRAGTGHAFSWYDLKREDATGIMVFPFCFMDTTAHYHMHLDTDAAFAQLRKMAQTLRDCSSPLITVFHNFSLGTDPAWKGWYEAYAQFVQDFS